MRAMLVGVVLWAGLSGRVRADDAPDDARTHVARAEAAHARGDTDEALRELDRAGELEGARDDLMLVRGKVLLDAGRSAEAEAALSRFLARHPDHYQALLARARASTRLGRHEDAQRDFAAALVAMSAPPPRVFLDRAQDLARAGQAEEALRVLEEGIRDLGPTPALAQAAVDLELALGRFDAALVRLDTMLQHSSRRETLLAKKAEVLERAGRQNEARAAREEALAAIDHLPQAKRGGQTKRLRGQLTAALAQPRPAPR